MMKYVAPLMVALAGVANPLVIPAAQAQDERSDWLDIELGKSVVLETPRVPKAVSITNPDVANVVQLGTATKWQVQGLDLGSTDLVIQFGPELPPMIYEVTVHRDLSSLVRRIDGLVADDPPRVYSMGDRVVVEGSVPDLDTLERVAQVAGIYDEEFVNLMTVRGDHQVQLEVIFAEVSRTGLRQMGFNILWLAPQLTLGLTQGPAAAGAAGGGGGAGLTPLSPLTSQPINQTNGVYNIPFGIGQGINLQGSLSVLNQHGLAKLIAQPTLVSLSGQRAEFLAGGEIPIPVPNQNGQVQIQYREFGTRLMFIPTVLADDVIDVQVQLEMSAIDEAVGARLNGFSVPGFSSRKVNGHVRLKSGMTFAIAGLLSERISMTRDEFPGLGRIPVIGALFRTITHQREESELLVYITPRLVRPMAPGEVPAILGTTENNNPGDLALFLLGADHRPKSRTANPTGEVGFQR